VTTDPNNSNNTDAGFDVHEPDAVHDVDLDTTTDTGTNADTGTDASTNADTGTDTILDAGHDAQAPDMSPDMVIDVAPECLTDNDCLDDNPCNGRETCDLTNLTCLPGTAAENGADCDLDADPATVEVCLNNACVLSTCGDGIVDATVDEMCDDGNLMTFTSFAVSDF
jgi:hypothetical protein